MSGGILSWGDFVLGGILSRGILSGGFCPGGFCPDTTLHRGSRRESERKQRLILPFSPSYTKLFRTHTLYQGGGGGGGDLDPTISSTLGCTYLKFCKVLEIPFKVSENTKFVKNPLYGYQWQLFDNMVLFANNCQNEYEKQVFFKCSQKPQIRRC